LIKIHKNVFKRMQTALNDYQPYINIY
jgi:hypothetical protein